MGAEVWGLYKFEGTVLEKLHLNACQKCVGI